GRLIWIDVSVDAEHDVHVRVLRMRLVLAHEPSDLSLMLRFTGTSRVRRSMATIRPSALYVVAVSPWTGKDGKRVAGNVATGTGVCPSPSRSVTFASVAVSCTSAERPPSATSDPAGSASDTTRPAAPRSAARTVSTAAPRDRGLAARRFDAGL